MGRRDSDAVLVPIYWISRSPPLLHFVNAYLNGHVAESVDQQQNDSIDRIDRIDRIDLDLVDDNRS